jgi:hypothetical protein
VWEQAATSKTTKQKNHKKSKKTSTTMAPTTKKAKRSTTTSHSKRSGIPGVVSPSEKATSTAVSTPNTANNKTPPLEVVFHVPAGAPTTSIKPTEFLTTFNMVTGVATAPPLDSTNPVDSVQADSVSKLSNTTANNLNKSEWLINEPNQNNINRVKIQLDYYIRNKFFNKCKFISAHNIQHWSNNENALCLKICKDMNVRKEMYVEFWEAHAVHINKTLNARRNDVRTLIKKDFLSKY